METLKTGCYREVAIVREVTVCGDSYMMHADQIC